MKEERLLEVAQKFSYQSTDDLLASVGYGKLSAAQVVTKLVPERAADETPKPSPAKKKAGSSHGVRVPGGVDNLLVRFARCCNPVPGDPIVGYVTRGRGGFRFTGKIVLMP